MGGQIQTKVRNAAQHEGISLADPNLPDFSMGLDEHREACEVATLRQKVREDIAFITSTTINVVGLFVLVAKWMYPAPEKRPAPAPSTNPARKKTNSKE